MTKRVCIVGIGWLGKELAIELKKLGHLVTGTTTSLAKKELLEPEFEGVNVFKLSDIDVSFLSGCDVLIFTVPPSSSDNYAELSRLFLGRVLGANPHVPIVYTSSTSVYGNEERKVDENSSINPSSASSKKIAVVEDYIKDKFKKHAILRLGGLIGGTRHPVKYLAGRSGVSKPLAPVNLLHRNDAVRATLHLINDFKCGVYNLCSENHPLKKSFYNGVARQHQMKAIEFDNDDFSKDKVVTCKAIKEIGFEFKYTSPYDFPFEV